MKGKLEMMYSVQMMVYRLQAEKFLRCSVLQNLITLMNEPIFQSIPSQYSKLEKVGSLAFDPINI